MARARQVHKQPSVPHTSSDGDGRVAVESASERARAWAKSVLDQYQGTTHVQGLSASASCGQLNNGPTGTDVDACSMAPHIMALYHYSARTSVTHPTSGVLAARRAKPASDTCGRPLTVLLADDSPDGAATVNLAPNQTLEDVVAAEMDVGTALSRQHLRQLRAGRSRAPMCLTSHWCAPWAGKPRHPHPGTRRR